MPRGLHRLADRRGAQARIILEATLPEGQHGLDLPVRQPGEQRQRPRADAGGAAADIEVVGPDRVGADLALDAHGLRPAADGEQHRVAGTIRRAGADSGARGCAGRPAGGAGRERHEFPAEPPAPPVRRAGGEALLGEGVSRMRRAVTLWRPVSAASSVRRRGVGEASARIRAQTFCTALGSAPARPGECRPNRPAPDRPNRVAPNRPAPPGSAAPETR